MSRPGALDSDGGAEVLELFRRLHAGGQTIVMVTHAAGGRRRRRTGRSCMRDGAIASDSGEA